MRKRPGRGGGRPRTEFTPLTDEEIAQSYAVEHVDGVGAIQSLDGRSAVQLSNGRKYDATLWRWSWDELADLGILEVRRAPTAEDPDPRYATVTGTQATHVPNSPAFYEWFPIVASRPLADVQADSNDDAFERYFRNANFYQVYYTDALFRRDEGNEPGAQMNEDARDAYLTLSEAYDEHRAAVDGASTVRDVQNADVTFQAVLDSLWRSPV